MERLKPWTAIIPLNEEYYITLKEKLSGQTLPIIRLKSRKVQQEGHPTLLSSKPWERYTYKEINSLYIDFNIEEPSHKDFNLQEQATRDRKRRLKAVFIDRLTLKVPYELGLKERTHYQVDFVISRVPKGSETRKAIQEDVRKLKSQYGIYPNISKRDKSYYARLFENPSCLEIHQIHQVSNPLISNKNGLLSGITKESQRFMSNLVVVSKGLVWDAYKRFDTQSGYVLDGIISKGG